MKIEVGTLIRHWNFDVYKSYSRHLLGKVIGVENDRACVKWSGEREGRWYKTSILEPLNGMEVVWVKIQEKKNTPPQP